VQLADLQLGEGDRWSAMRFTSSLIILTIGQICDGAAIRRQAAGLRIRGGKKKVVILRVGSRVT